MTSFLGTHRHTVDAKGRLSIPSKFRKATGDVFIVTRGLDGCLFLYPKEEWDLIAQKVRSLEWTEDDPRFFAREFAAYAHEMTVDSHGRVMIPQELRDGNRHALTPGGFEQQAVDFVGEQLRHGVDGAADDGRVGGHGPGDRGRRNIARRGHDHHVRDRDELLQRMPITRAHQR